MPVRNGGRTSGGHGLLYQRRGAQSVPVKRVADVVIQQTRVMAFALDHPASAGSVSGKTRVSPPTPAMQSDPTECRKNVRSRKCGVNASTRMRGLRRQEFAPETSVFTTANARYGCRLQREAMSNCSPSALSRRFRHRRVRISEQVRSDRQKRAPWWDHPPAPTHAATATRRSRRFLRAPVHGGPRTTTRFGRKWRAIASLAAPRQIHGSGA